MDSACDDLNITESVVIHERCHNQAVTLAENFTTSVHIYDDGFRRVLNWFQYSFAEHGYHEQRNNQGKPK